MPQPPRIQRIIALEKLPDMSHMLSLKEETSSLRETKMRRSLSGSLLNPSVIDDAAASATVDVPTLKTDQSTPTGVVLSISRTLDERLFDPHFKSRSTALEQQMADSATDLKFFGAIDGLLRIIKVASFIACPLLLIFSLGRVRSEPLLAILCGIAGLDFLRVSYNCYVKNYCVVGLRRYPQTLLPLLFLISR